MQIFDKSQIKANFSKHSKNYNNQAVLQKIVCKNLVKLAKKEIIHSSRIIDLGCGTGFIKEEIERLNISNIKETKKIYQLDISYQMLVNNRWDNKINGDIEMLPFGRNYFDLALSSLSFQWLNNIPNSIAGIFNYLKTGGNFFLALIGEGSLIELKKSSACHKNQLAVNNFIDQITIENFLEKKNYKYSLKEEKLVLIYNDFYDLLRSIKSIGAGYSQNKKYIGKKQFSEMANFYLKNFHFGDKVQATWRIFYISIIK